MKEQLKCCGFDNKDEDISSNKSMYNNHLPFVESFLLGCFLFFIFQIEMKIETEAR